MCDREENVLGSIGLGEVAEWSIASDLKSDEAKVSGSSNLPLSVLLKRTQLNQRSPRRIKATLS